MILEDLVKECNSWSELYREHFNKGTPNGRTLTKFKQDHSYLDTKHFDKWAVSRKYNDVVLDCPVCGKPFKTKDGGYEKKTTCSHSCANTYFRTGDSHGNWNPDSYRSTCFHYHKKECVICKEDKIVTVHHLDENHENNSPDNLIPLCPTHHQYWHSRYKHLIEDEVLSYVSNWKQINLGSVMVAHRSPKPCS